MLPPRRPIRALLLASIALPIALDTASHAQIAGDECSNAIPVAIGPVGPVDTATMTPSANAPANEACPFLYWNNSKDVWFHFWADAPGTLSLDFCESTFDTSVVVYEGTGCSLTRIGCDDDGCPTATNFQSRVTGLHVAGGGVWIRVGGYYGATGTVRFNLSYAPDPDLGLLYMVGNGDQGQTTPQPYLGYVKAVASTTYHTLALRASGTVVAWGNNDCGQCNVPGTLNQVTGIAAGNCFSLALRADGTVTQWGVLAPTPATATGVIQIGAGLSHAIALRSGGSVVCWGSNDSGQCNVPAGLPSCVDVDAWGRYSLAARSDGLVAAWGNAPTPPAVAVTNAVKVAAGEAFAGALRSDGTVACWGANGSGQSTPPAGLSGVVDIAAGYNHMLALRSDGNVVSWGNSGYGSRNIPNAGAPYVAIDGGSFNSFAISRGDCDSNGIFDLGELGRFDCNGNDLPDCWDFEFGWAEDCNSNGIADECEKQLDIGVNSGQLGPIGFGSPQVFEIAAVAPAVGDVQLTVRGRGDFSGDLEYVTLVCGTQFSRQMLAGTGDCANYPPYLSLTMTADQFNDGIGADGRWRLDIVPSSAVNASLCPKGSWVQIVADYTAANSADCDLNGELDSCQIAAGSLPDTNGNGIPDTCESAFDSCPTDIDGDGTTGASDLSLLLSVWGSTNPDADLDGDGSVGASDLSLLLASWGPCPID